MYIDFIIAVFLIICIFRGDRRGLVRSFISTFGWIISMASGYIFRNTFVTYMDSTTTMRADLTVKITEYIKNRLLSGTAGADPDGTIPGAISSALSTAASNALNESASAAAQPIADAIMNLLAFFMLVIGIKFVMYFVEFVVHQFTKKNKVLSSADHIFGMVFGLIKGLIVAYVALMLVVMIALLGDFTPLLTNIQDSMAVNGLNTIGLIPFSLDALENLTV